jgi:hypothetical protein
VVHGVLGHDDMKWEQPAWAFPGEAVRAVASQPAAYQWGPWTEDRREWSRLDRQPAAAARTSQGKLRVPTPQY